MKFHEIAQKLASNDEVQLENGVKLTNKGFQNDADDVTCFNYPPKLVETNDTQDIYDNHNVSSVDDVDSDNDDNCQNYGTTQNSQKIKMETRTLLAGQSKEDDHHSSILETGFDFCIQNDDDEHHKFTNSASTSTNNFHNSRKSREESVELFICSLCQMDCGSSEDKLRKHLTEVHSVTNEGLERLLSLLPSTSHCYNMVPNGNQISSSGQQRSTVDGCDNININNNKPYNAKSISSLCMVSTNSQKFLCPMCTMSFDLFEQLFTHQVEFGHMPSQNVNIGCYNINNNNNAICTNQTSHESRDSQPMVACGDHHKSQVESHTSHNAYRFRCPQCSLAFISESKLQAHKQYHVFRAATKCQICDKVFRSIAAFKKHNEIHVTSSPNPGPSGYESSFAGGNHYLAGGTSSATISNDLPSNSASHVTMAHVESHVTTNSSSIDERLNCTERARYAYANEPDRKYRCHQCKLAFTKNNYILAHNKIVHHRRGERTMTINFNKYNDPSRPFKCEICHESFTQKSILLVHLNSVLHLHRLKTIQNNKSNVSSTVGQVPNLNFGGIMASRIIDNNKSHVFSSMRKSHVPNKVGPKVNEKPEIHNTLNYRDPLNWTVPMNRPVIRNNVSNMETSDINNEIQFLHEPSQVNEHGPEEKDKFTYETLLEDYGFEAVVHYNECRANRKRKFRAIVCSESRDLDEKKRAKLDQHTQDENLHKNENLHILGPGTDSIYKCSHCKHSFTNVWVLKYHLEHKHKEMVPLDEIEKVSEEFHQVSRKAHNEDVNKSQKIEDTTKSTVKVDKAYNFSDIMKLVSTSDTPDRSLVTTSAGGTSTTLPNFGIPYDIYGTTVASFLPMVIPQPMPYVPVYSVAQASSGPNISVSMPGSSAGSSIPSTMPMLVPSNQQQQSNRRARTKITETQVNVLLEYFDINNSPSEEQVEKMALQTGLPQKVIKHWFRNTLFKERQRSKDSPYNFSIPPSLGIDLETYEKTGETKVKLLDSNLDIGKEPKIENHVTESENLHNPESKNVHKLMEHVVKQEIEPDDSPDVSNVSSHVPLTSHVPVIKHMEPANQQMTTKYDMDFSMAFCRRANRTRFTETQVQKLHNYFDQNPYPKDNDLELLSQELNLNPRVIIVWFQNMRQKTRKTFENNSSPDDGSSSSPTNSAQNLQLLNYQCQKCNMSFNRFTDLAKHQKLVCGFDKCAKKELLFASGMKSKSVSPNNSADDAEFDDTESSRRSRTNISPGQLQILNETYAKNPKPSNELMDHLCNETGLRKKVVQVWFQNCRMRQRQDDHVISNPPKLNTLNDAQAGTSGIVLFNKRCPFCGILCHSKLSMDLHISAKHPNQYKTMEINIDKLPNVSEGPKMSHGVNLHKHPPPLDLSKLPQIYGPQLFLDENSKMGSRPHSTSMNSNDDEISYYNNSMDDNEDSHSYNSLGENSPSPLLRSSNSHQSGNNPGQKSMVPAKIGQSRSDPQSSPSQYHQGHHHKSKRFRTHLNQQQIKILKYFFRDFKTPNMSECEMLGNEIGLYRRVVQVWFQNARAKERKSKSSENSQDSEISDNKLTRTDCSICNLKFPGRLHFQEHSFTKSHVTAVKRTILGAGGEQVMENLGANDRDMDFGAQNFFNDNRLIIDEDNQSNEPEHVTFDPDPETGTASSSRVFDQSEKNSSIYDHGIKPQKLEKDGPPPLNFSGNRANKQQKFGQEINQQQIPQLIPSNNTFQNCLPYFYTSMATNPLASAYYASMMISLGFSGFPNGGNSPSGGFLYDPNLNGTPVNLLQVPPTVAQSILASMQNPKQNSCRFPLDGKNVDNLKKSLSSRENQYVEGKDVEVGWACRTCCTVFPSETLLINHQQLICRTSQPCFTLIQTHYGCTLCSTYYGTQVEYKAHIATYEHQAKLKSSL